MLRTWPALLAWGAGLIHLAIGASIVAPSGDVTRALCAPMLLIGSVELGWGIAVLRAGRIIGGRGAAAGAIAAVLLGAVSLGGGAPVGAVAISSALVVVGGSMAARAARKGEGSARALRVRATGMALGVFLVAAVATPALALTDAVGHGSGHDHGGDLVVVDPHSGH
ncbi:hypothetical protein RL72_01626 [Microbacterium azadirachtae]|uniref:Uncharacterized protein n=1 Tax=Microbacterium azadirachtae TaxID=582680 RepID=A0A0F0KVK0_9MICO|nr:hypothetical protein [Microbacterium azadirachtae]KJL24903.1 hypothetical protein RL72_01626 [Microbacterium azadirachtae]